MYFNRNLNIRPFALIAISITILLIAVTSAHPVIHTVLLCSLMAYLYKSNHGSHIEGSDGSDYMFSDEMREEHQLLLESVRHYPMPFAIYDKNDRLVIWNRHYEGIYAHTFDSIKDKLKSKNLYYRDLLISNAEKTMSGQELQDYVDLRVANQRNEDGLVVDREYPNLGWYRVSKYMTPSGGVAGIAIDINELKQRETELMQEVERRKRLEIKILKLANTDSLTGISNRRHFIDRLAVEFNRARQSNCSLCVMMIDIDHFKSVNDNYGHATGDEVITTVAKMAESILPIESNLIGRLGGEEFAILLTEITEEVCCQFAEDIRQSIESLSFMSDGYTFAISVSVGVTFYEKSDLNNAALMKRSDDALYSAKANGRNRVEIAYNDGSNNQRAAG